MARLTDRHMRPVHLAHDYPPSRRAVYRFFRDAGNTGPDCALLSLADHMATRVAAPESESWAAARRDARLPLEAYFRDRAERVTPAPLMNGHQLMTALGLKPGPEVGGLLDDLREAQAVGEVTIPRGCASLAGWRSGRVGGAVLHVEIAVAKVAKYVVRESGDSVEVVERPHGGLSVVMADGQRSGRSAKAISNVAVRKSDESACGGGPRRGRGASAHDYLRTQRSVQVSAELTILSVDLETRTVVISCNSQCRCS